VCTLTRRLSESAQYFYCRTVVRETRLVNGAPRFLDPRGSKTPERIDSKFNRGDYVGDITPHANFGICIPKALYIYVKLSSSVFIFLHPRYFFITCGRIVAVFDRFSCFMAQKAYLRDSYLLFGARTKIVIISLSFAENALFPIPAM